MHTHIRLIATASAVAVASSLLTGCDLRDWSGRVSVEHHNPDQPSSSSAKPSSTATSSPKPSQQASNQQASQPTARHSNRTHATTIPQSTVKPTELPSSATSALGTTTEKAVVKLVNAARAKKDGCGALRIDSHLRKAAYLHSRDMGLHHYFDHNSQNGDTPWDRIRAAGYAHPSAENIAAGQQTATSVMDAWMNSEGHRANILNCSYKAIGVGLWKAGGTPIWTQDFGFE